MSSNQLLIILIILAFNLAGLGLVLVFLGAKRSRGQRSRRLTDHSTSSATWRDVAPVFDDVWPEICFDMDVRTTCFAGVVSLFLALFATLMAGMVVGGGKVRPAWSILIFLFPLLFLIPGCEMLLSCVSQWRSRIVLEGKRLVIYPAFKRSPRVVNYDQICYVDFGEQRIIELTGALIRYHPLDYGGQVDVTRMYQMGLPFTSQNEGLRLVLQARMAGPPIDRTLELALVSKLMAKRLAVLPILFGIALFAIVLQPDGREQVLLLPVGLLEAGLLLLVIVVGWPAHRS